MPSLPVTVSIMSLHRQVITILLNAGSSLCSLLSCSRLMLNMGLQLKPLSSGLS